MVMAPELSSTSQRAGNHGGRLVSADGRELPLRGVHLSAEAGGGIARVVLTQRFHNPYEEPLHVRYLLPLPSDGAVSGFRFRLGDQVVEGEVTGRQQARERFARAVSQGKTAALLEQDRSSLFSQQVGNVPAGCEVVAELTIDQPLRWLADGAWEWRFPTVVGARYQGAEGRVPDAEQLSVPVAAQRMPLGATLGLTIVDALTGSVESTSHPTETRRLGLATGVRFEADGAARLDRDVVVRWPVALPSVSASVVAERPATAAHEGDAFALLSVAPPTSGGLAVPRDLIFLIDTSGSMGGRPLDQAKAVCAAMIHTLGAQDRLELIEFGSYPRRWKAGALSATEANKAKALQWIMKLQASGCTEMHRAVLEALAPLRPDSQRQVVLVTDGYIGFEREIVAALLERLPRGARLHTVGVGSAVNRSLTEAAARAGRGTELIVGLEEDAERVAARLVARTTAPLVTDLEVAGALEVAPRSLPDLYAESPALIAVRVSGAGGEVVLRGRTAEGPFEQRLTVPALGQGQGQGGVAALFAREKVEDLEAALTAGGAQRELERTIEDTGVAFQIATRLTSWVAVTKQATVAAEARAREVEQPHELPHGVSAEGLGLRPVLPSVQAKPAPSAQPARPRAPAHRPQRIGDYEVVDTLGQGGMGAVFLARKVPSADEKQKDARFISAEDAQRDLGIDADELDRLVSNAELRAFRQEGELGFKADDVSNLKQGRETEPTLILTDSDQSAGIVSSGEEPILQEQDGRISAKTPGELLAAGKVPTIEVPGVSEDMGLIETESGAALVEVGSDDSTITEAFELMDADDAPQTIARQGAMPRRSRPADSRLTSDATMLPGPEEQDDDGYTRRERGLDAPGSHVVQSGVRLTRGPVSESAAREVRGQREGHVQAQAQLRRSRALTAALLLFWLAVAALLLWWIFGAGLGGPSPAGGGATPQAPSPAGGGGRK